MLAFWSEMVEAQLKAPSAGLEVLYDDEVMYFGKKVVAMK